MKLKLFSRFNFIDAVIASTADGVPLMRGFIYFNCSFIVVNPSSTVDIDSEEVEFPVSLAIVAEHVLLL